MMLTGCRLSEIQRLGWEHVVLKAGELRLPVAKNGGSMKEEAREILAVVRVFAKRTRRTPRREIELALKRAGETMQ